MARDPRQIITPDAFTVAPELLGIGLARPSRRLIAIAIDGILIAIMANIGGNILLALGFGVMLWRGSAKPAVGASRGLMRNALRIISIIFLVTFAVQASRWAAEKVGANSIAKLEKKDKDPEKQCGIAGIGNKDIDFRALGLSFGDMRMLPAVIELGEAEDSAEAAPMADSIARWVGTRPDTMRERIATALVDAMNDEGVAAATRVALAPYLPPDTISTAEREKKKLEADLAVLNCQNNVLREKLESEQQGFSIKKLFKGLSDVLGFGLGWSALYFTAMLVLMHGQTPGKKLLGIRVIRLDGKPITGWIAFERFGGYAASAATGLLGFAQILWDRNRQALHDKATETVVIREKNGVPVRPLEASMAAGAPR
jgi:hypothetical protein